MSIQKIIKEKLQTNLNIKHLEIVNESDSHNVPSGSESHFKVIIVSNDFDDTKLVIRHKMVYKILSEELKTIHALALHTYNTTDWPDSDQFIRESPNCHGGS